MREPGYYWVRTGKYKSWEIARFEEDILWYFPGVEYGFDEDEFEFEIDEIPIMRTQETTPSTSISETGYIGE